MSRGASILGIGKQVARLAGRLVRDRRANVAVVFALVFPALLALGGFGIDLSNSSSQRAKMDAALDAVVLGTTRQVVSGSLEADDQEQLQAYATRLFNANLESSGADAGRVELNSMNVQVFREPGGVRTVASYSADYNMWFGGMVGFEAMPLGREAEARSSVPTYIDFHLVIDVSPSMGLAANAAEAARMKTLMNCTFACHTTTDGTDSLGRARRHGIKLRIDSIKTAAMKAIDLAEERAVEEDQYRFSVQTVSKTLVELQRMTADLPLAKTKVSDMNLTLHSGGLTAYSYFTTSIAALESTVEDPGTGRTPDSRLKYVIFATDGLEHWAGPGGGRRHGALNPAICQRMKDRGIVLLVLYTTYLPIPDNSAWRTMVRPYEHQLAPNLRSCASPDGYFEAEDDASIDHAMQQIFAKALGQNRIAR